MTRKRDAKRKVRRRMAETGERYTVARDAIFPTARPSAGLTEGNPTTMSTTTDLRIELATGSPVEQEAEQRLRELLGRWTLDHLVYLDRLIISEEAARSGGVHAPLLAASDLLGDEDHALAAFVHAQLHVALWDVENRAAAEEDARARFSAATSQPDLVLPCLVGSAASHVVIAGLELAALSALLGDERALGVLRARPGGLFAEVVFGEPSVLGELLARHDVVLPVVPAGHERAGSSMTLGRGGPVATLATGKDFEVRLASRLADLHDRFELARWRFASEVAIDTARPNVVDASRPSLSTYFVFAPDADLVMNYVQVQAGWRARQLSLEDLEAALGAFADQVSFGGLERGRALQVLYAVAISLVAGTALLAEDEVTSAIERHPRNRQLLQRLRPELDDVVRRLRHRAVPVDNSE